METGSTRVRVVPGSAGRWEVREPGSTRALLEVESPTVAVVRARKLLTRGGTVEILDQAGLVLETHVVPPPSASQSWWYMPPKKLFWVLGALFLAQGVFHLVVDGLGWPGVLFSFAGALYLSCLTASHRRHSRIAGGGSESTTGSGSRQGR